jgi:hypothetical protein
MNGKQMRIENLNKFSDNLSLYICYSVFLHQINEYEVCLIKML